MAIRQYIGARYVPRFRGEYNNTTQYDALDVVDNGGGTSYIARKTVPAGTPLTDTEHWFIYGASSGAILDLQNRMTNAENDIDDLYSQVDVANKRFWYIGDSFLANTSFNWGEKLDTLLGKNNSYVTAEGAIGICNPGLGGVALPAKISGLTNVPDDITDVIIICGHNDCKSAYFSTLRSDFISLINAIKTKAGNDINIYFAFNATYYDHSNAYFADACASMGGIYSFLRLLCLQHNVGFIESPLFQIQYRALLQADGTHPTEQGITLMAQCLAEYILHRIDTTTPYNTKVNSKYIFNACQNRYVDIIIPQSTVLYSGAAISRSAGVFGDEIDTITLPVMPKNNRQFTIPIPCMEITDNGGVYESCIIDIYQNGKVYVELNNTHSSITRLRTACECRISVDLFEDLRNH